MAAAPPTNGPSARPAPAPSPSGGTNTYSGGTNVTGGTLSVSSDANLGNGGTVALGDGTGITFTAGGTYSHDITVAGDPTFDVGTGLTVTQSGQIADGATPGDVEVTGGGTLVLTNTLNSYSGGTVVTGSSTLSIGADSVLGNTGGGLTLGDATTGGTLATAASFDSARTVTLESRRRHGRYRERGDDGPHGPDHGGAGQR